MRAVKTGAVAATLTAGTFALMNITTVVSLRGLAAESEYGLSAVFFYLFAALFFLIPVSLVAAELATGWPQEGGVFRWIGAAFGQRLGLLAIYLQWLATTICFPTMLIFAAVALAYTGNYPAHNAELAASKDYTLAVVLAVYWLATFITLHGVKSASRISALGGLIGTLIPALILLVCGIWYVASGHPVHLAWSWDGLLPQHMQWQTWVLAASIFLYYSGMEINAVHVRQLEQPSRNYPLSIAITAVVTVVVLILGTLTISAVLPHNDMNLVQGLLHTYDLIFSSMGCPWLGQILAAMLAIGVLGQVTVIVAGPSSGLLVVGREGMLPRWMQQVNRHGVQRNILLLQGAIVSVLSIVLVCLPSVQAAFQILGQLSGLLYLLMYILLFAAAIALRYRAPEVVRPYQIPGGKAGMWLVGGAGFCATGVAFILSFMPPSQIVVGSAALYVGILIVGAIGFVSVPFILYALRRPEWNTAGNNTKA
ncbi:MAG: putative glutamine/gamma-aminobutyrate antiporter GadC [Plesiomonas shigelloides]